MTITLNLPEDIARHLAARGEDPGRVALEALALEAYRSGTLTEEQIRRMLGFDTGPEVHAFLKRHNMRLNYSASDFADDLGKSLGPRG
jgi:hypothetical protein